MGPSVLKFVVSLWVLTDMGRYFFDKELVNLLKELLENTKKIQRPGNYFQAYLCENEKKSCHHPRFKKIIKLFQANFLLINSLKTSG